MKKKVTATVYYHTFEEFNKAILDLFARLPDYQQELKSLLILKFQIPISPLLAKQASGWSTLPLKPKTTSYWV